MTITDRQLQVYEIINAFIEAHGYAPSYEEIGRACGITARSGVKFHIDKLVKHKLITRRNGRARTMTVNGQGQLIG